MGGTTLHGCDASSFPTRPILQTAVEFVSSYVGFAGHPEFNHQEVGHNHFIGNQVGLCVQLETWLNMVEPGF